ncbi:hypothetical protein ACLUEY_17765, partial [Vreelandella aquamarina]
EVLRSAYEEMVIKSGADGPEAQLSSLLQIGLRANDPLTYLSDGSVDMDATGVGYRPDALRTMVLLTDADYHVAGDGESSFYLDDDLPANNGDKVLDGDPAGTGEDYPSIDQVRDALEDGGIYPIFAVTGSQLANYEALVAELGFGAVVELSSDSDNLVDVLTTSLEDYKADFVVDLIGTEFDDQLTGNGLDNTIDAGAGDDWVYALGGNNTISGDAGADTFVLGFAGPSRGVTTITDFSNADGDILALDNDGLMSFGEDVTDGDALGADGFTTRDTLADIVAGDDGLVVLQTAISSADSSTVTADSVEAYLMAFNSDTGMAELWFDADWSDAEDREQVAAVESLDELADVVGLTEDDFALSV